MGSGHISTLTGGDLSAASYPMALWFSIDKYDITVVRPVEIRWVWGYCWHFVVMNNGEMQIHLDTGK